MSITATMIKNRPLGKPKGILFLIFDSTHK
nr:MAG TPA: hypothetical protein [Caudoviricetes sp.]DAN20303.1 MAG TPA: hypothetical protein [Caudoviricetes sp.]